MQEQSDFSAADRRAGVDVEVYRKTEAALRDRERELSQLVDMVPSHLWRLSANGEPIFFNKRMVDYLALDVGDIDRPGITGLDALIVSAVHPDDATPFRDNINRSLATGETFAMRYRLRRADGIYRWMSSRAEPLRDQDDRIVQWYGLCHDIDDQVQAEESLRRSERHLQQLIDALPIHIVSWTPAGQLTYVSRRYLEQTGLSEPSFEEFARATQDLVHPEDQLRVQQAAMGARETGAAFAMRYRRRVPDGTYRWMDGRFEPMCDQDGTILEWYGLSIDIDDQVKIEETLRSRERELSQLVDALPTQIWAATAQGEPSYLNRRLADYVGLTLDDLDKPDASRLQAAIQGSVHPDDAAPVGDALAHAFATGQTFAMKYRQRRADGVYRWINGRAEPMRDASGRIRQWYGVSFDIDDDVRIQEELARTQERLAVASQAASLAELSASIAHEVNQPLAAVVANSHAAQRWLASDPPNIERARIAVDRIIRDANGAADVVSHIRALFKQSRGGRTLTGIDSVVTEARELLAGEAARRGVRIEVQIEAGLATISLDPVQIQQVLINLIRNGIEAMAPVGNDRLLRIKVGRLDGMVQTEISDTGPGMEFPERMFETFFTTKDHGMGMGLAISRTIVEAHGGRLWAEKNEPQGARLSFTLPAEVANEY